MYNAARRGIWIFRQPSQVATSVPLYKSELCKGFVSQKGASLETAFSGIAPVEPQRNSDTVWLCNGFIGNRPFFMRVGVISHVPGSETLLSAFRRQGQAPVVLLC